VFQALEAHTPGLADSSCSASPNAERSTLTGQVPALCHLPGACKPGGEIRLLEYTRPHRYFRRLLTRGVRAGVRWTCNVSFHRNVMRNVPPQGSPY
jgi:hypothetical protein